MGFSKSPRRKGWSPVYRVGAVLAPAPETQRVDTKGRDGPSESGPGSGSFL